MERMVQALAKAVDNTARKAVSGMTRLCQSKSLFSMADEVVKRLVVIGPEVLLVGVVKRLLGGTGVIGSVAMFVLDIIIDLRPWKKD